MSQLITVLPYNWKLFQFSKKVTKPCVSNLTLVTCKFIERNITELKEWIFRGQHGYRQDFSRESKVVTLFPELFEEMDNGGRIKAIIIEFAKPLDASPHDFCCQDSYCQSGCALSQRISEWANSSILCLSHSTFFFYNLYVLIAHLRL